MHYPLIVGFIYLLITKNFDLVFELEPYLEITKRFLNEEGAETKTIMEVIRSIFSPSFSYSLFP